MVPDSDSAEQEEPQLNVPEITTTANNTKENTNTIDTQPIEIAHTEGPELVERDELGRTGLTTQAEGADMSTPMATERAQDAQQSEEVPMNINDMGPPTTTEHEEDVRMNSPINTTPGPDHSQHPELTILDILEDE